MFEGGGNNILLKVKSLSSIPVDLRAPQLQTTSTNTELPFWGALIHFLGIGDAAVHHFF